MTQLRILPVRHGEACLLQCRRGNYLLDGGGPGNGLVGMLRDRKIKRLRAAICSSASEGRLGGILELMASDIVVAEYWLPADLERLIESARRYAGSDGEWLAAALKKECPEAPSPDTHFPPPSGSRGRLVGAARLARLALSLLQEEPSATPDVSARSPKSALLDLLRHLHGRDSDSVPRPAHDRERHGCDGDRLARQCGETLLATARQLSGGPLRGPKAILTGLALGITAAGLLNSTQARLSFFDTVLSREDHLVPRHPIVCVNGRPTDPLEGIADTTGPHDILQLAQAIVSHRHGLAFRYGDAGCGVLFCGDSRLRFLDNDETILLDRPTIITAPRQGSTTADAAYQRIASRNAGEDIWIRSHSPSVRKVSPFYQAISDKCCLWNCRDNTIQEILLKYQAGAWHLRSGSRCRCRGATKKEAHIPDVRFWLP